MVLAELYSDLYVLNINGEDTSKTNTNTSDLKPESSDSKPPKKPKPNLTLDLPAKDDSEKDKHKIAMCTHDNHSLFMPETLDDCESTVCDFDSGSPQTEQGGHHKAFDGLIDAAFICNNCHAILCKNCVEDYTPENSPKN
jgi:hypothetical protein